jgi:peptidyl-tRNA hydrolase, PTH1 family
LRPPIRLIAGLGNPGREHSGTRHNAGFWFVDRLAVAQGAHFSSQHRFHGDTARFTAGSADCWLLKPRTYMNESGRSVQALAAYYQIETPSILVVHDEIDLPSGVARRKDGGGSGGHNGIKDVSECLGSQDFLRLRLGVGHPGRRDVVVDHVLNRPDAQELELIEDAIGRALTVLPMVLEGRLEAAMNALHRRAGTDADADEAE